MKEDEESKWDCYGKCENDNECEFEWVRNPGKEDEKAMGVDTLTLDLIPKMDAKYYCR